MKNQLTRRDNHRRSRTENEAGCPSSWSPNLLSKTGMFLNIQTLERKVISRLFKGRIALTFQTFVPSTTLNG